MEKKFYWIKLKENFMLSNTVDYLMQQKHGAEYVVLYQMLCLKAVNFDGKLSDKIGEITIAFDAEKIARDCKWFSVETVRYALNLYKSLGLIYVDNDGSFAISGFHDLVGSESDAALRMRSLRSQRNANTDVTDGEQCSNNVTAENRDKENRDKENRDKENRDEEGGDEDCGGSKNSQPPCPYEKIADLFNGICVSFPKIRGIEGKRREAVAARWKTYRKISVFEELFRTAESSEFLKGKNKQNWKADFDWFMMPSNFQKVLENKYEKNFGDCKPEEPKGSETARRAVEATWAHIRKVLAESDCESP